MTPALLSLVLMAAPVQDTLQLAALQDSAVMHDPRLRQVALAEAATALRLRNLAVERLPAFSLTGEATHQSEVAELPIALPNIDVPRPPKSRYELALSADWRLLDGGVVRARREVERANLAAAHAELAAQLYPLRLEVVDAFFSVLIVQERARELDPLIETLDARLKETRARVAAGAALPADTAVVRAELLRALQQRAELAADRGAALAVLEDVTGRAISPADVLAVPSFDLQLARVTSSSGDVRSPDSGVVAEHPQYAVFAAERARLERQTELVRANVRPQLTAFGQYAYGRPGLQQFADELHDYWHAGLRLKWSPWSWGSTEREIEVFRLQQQIVDTERAAFTASLLRQVQQPLAAMERLPATIATDEQIVELLAQVERQARAQFAEHAITAADYVDAATDLQAARTTLVRHRVELARAQARYLTTLGIELR